MEPLHEVDEEKEHVRAGAEYRCRQQVWNHRAEGNDPASQCSNRCDAARASPELLFIVEDFSSRGVIPRFAFVAIQWIFQLSFAWHPTAQRF